MYSESESLKRQGHTRVQWGVAILVNLTVLTYGLQCGWVSPMTKILQSPESPAGPLTDSEISLIAGLPALSAMFGILTWVYVVDTFGRKRAILCMTLFQLMCWIIKLCPANSISLLIARLLCGFGAGGCFHVVPMYIKEISQDNIRGTLGSTGILFQNVGILAMYCFGGYLDYYTVLYIVVGIPVATFVMVLRAPESPSFLVKKGKLEEAAKTIALLRGLDVKDKEVLAEVDLIRKEDDYFNSIPNISFIKIFEEIAWRRGFLIMLVIIFFHGLNGGVVIINYASTLFALSKVDISPELQTLGVPIFLTIGTSITMTTVDKLGRKMLLGISFAIIGLNFAIFASALVLNMYGWSTPGWIPIVTISLIVCFYGAGVSPVPLIIMSELFNFQVRAKLMACLSITAWGMNFVQLLSYAAITSSLGTHSAFFIFSVIGFGGAAVTLIFLPETGGKTVDQIETELRKGKKINKKIGF